MTSWETITFEVGLYYMEMELLKYWTKYNLAGTSFHYNSPLNDTFYVPSTNNTDVAIARLWGRSEKNNALCGQTASRNTHMSLRGILLSLSWQPHRIYVVSSFFWQQQTNQQILSETSVLFHDPENHHFVNPPSFIQAYLQDIRPIHQVPQNRDNWKQTVWRPLGHSSISFATMPRISVWWQWTAMDIQKV